LAKVYQEDYSSERILDMVKFLIKLYNNYLFFIYKWVDLEKKEGGIQ
jgi:hypothetical protein